MTLAQAVLQIFYSQGSIGLQLGSRKKTSNKAITLQRQVRRKRKKERKKKKKKKKNTGPLNFRMYVFHIKNFKIISLTVHHDRMQV